MVEVFREVRRVLKKDGTLWLNLGDSYCHDRFTSKMDGTFEGTDGLYSRKFHYMDGCSSSGPKRTGGIYKTKDMMGIPWRIAFALQADGWYLRSDIIWSKPNPMPESVTDRPTKAHEYVFLMSKKSKYYYDADAIKEPQTDSSLIRARTPYLVDLENRKHKPDDKYAPCLNPNTAEITRQKCLDGEGRNKRTVWTIPTQPYSEAHFATFPEALVEPCILAGCPERGVVYDPFMGAGTVAKVALRANRQFIGSEINPDYVKIAEKRIEPLLKQISLFP